MSQSSVYLCPSCQEVIRSEGRSQEDLVCKACGFELSQKSSLPGDSKSHDLPAPPVSNVTRDVAKSAFVGKTELPGSPLPEPVKAKVPEIQKAEIQKKEKEKVIDRRKEGGKEIILPDGTRQVRRRKKRRKEKNKTLYLFLGGWILVIVAIVALFQMDHWMEDDSDDGGETDSQENMHRNFLRTNRSAASAAFGRFLQTPVPDGKIQLVDRSSEMAAKFGRFYDFEPPIVPSPGLQPEDVRMLEFAKRKVTPGIEIIWRTREGNFIEVLSLWDGNEWRVDWEHLVRYSSQAWSIFKLDAGDPEGEFRLFVRKKDISTDEITEVAFHSPGRQGTSEIKNVFSVSRSHSVDFPAKEELGLQFNALWNDFLAGERVYDSKFPERDPRGLMRITVRLGWKYNSRGERVMKLLKIYEPSWYGTRVQEIFKEYPPVSSPIIDQASTLLQDR